jgi:glycosyltransferase involved in cell wall biosynthesis
MGKTKQQILDLYRVHKFDVISAQGITGTMIPQVLQDRLVVTLHGNNLQRGLALCKFARSSEIRNSVHWAPESFFRNIVGHYLYGGLERRACKVAKLVITLTPTEAYYARKNYSVPNQRIRIVPNAIVGPESDGSRIAQIPERKKIILSVGSLEFIKGTPILTKAMRLVLASTKDIIFVTVGDGPLMNCVRMLKDEYPERVVVIRKACGALHSLYARSTVLVQGSLYEAFSLSIGEAMLAGKPVVAFRLSSIPDLVIENVTGRLVKPASVSDLAMKTLNLIENEEEMRTMGLNAKRIVNKFYSVRVVGSLMENVLKEVY